MASHESWRLVARRAGLGAIGTIGALAAYGVAVEPRFIYQREYAVRIPNLPAAWHGRRVALAADFQVGMFLGNHDTIRRMIRRLVSQPPDLLLFAGDFIYHPSGRAVGEVAIAERLIRPLIEADIPVVAVLGNHDYGVNTPDQTPDFEAADHVRRVMERLGVYVLQNSWVALAPPESGATPIRREEAQAVRLVPSEAGHAHGNGDQSDAGHHDAARDTRGSTTPSDRHLYVVGVGSHWMGQDDPQEALRGVPADAARIALMHNPASFPAFPAHSAPFAVAAHTHGGQVRLPHSPHWSYLSLVRGHEVHADGWTRPFGQEGNELYVSIGVGFSTIPVRINCMPELTIFTLQPQSAGPERWVPLRTNIGL